MENNMKGEVVNLSLSKLEDEVNEVLKRPIPHMEDLGRLSSEAVLQQFEHAAKSWLDMGTEVKDRIAKLEDQLAQADRDLKLIAECAETIRDKGKLAAAQIDEASALSGTIAKLANDLKTTMGSK
jgi:predicted  nucleic acid-binding Zn-ribbon protein